MHAAKAIETVLLDMKSGKISPAARTAWISRLQEGCRLRQMESIDERFAPRT